MRVRQHVLAGFGAGAEQDVHGGVAAVIEDHVGDAAIGPLEDLVGIVPVFLERLALDGEDRNAGGSDGGSGMVLGREDVAGGPADFGAERNQRLDQHGRLDGHVQRAGDARALQRLLRAEFFAAGHQARHFGFGDRRFPCGQNRQADIGDHIVLFSAHGSISEAECRARIAFWRVGHAHRETHSASSGIVPPFSRLREGNNDIKKSLYVYVISSGPDQISSPNLSASAASSASSASWPGGRWR
jgi:hypothetical protein